MTSREIAKQLVELRASFAAKDAEIAALREALEGGVLVATRLSEKISALREALLDAKPAVIICLGTGKLPGFTTVLPRIDAALEMSGGAK